MFNYFPEDEQFYVDITGSEQRGRLVHKVYVAFNRDLRLFVEERLMSPTLAREEIQRINDAVFRSIVEVVADVFVAGGAQVVASRIAASAAATAEAALKSFRDKRSLFSLSMRRGVPTIVVFRGTTIRWRWGDVADLVHDLGQGIYFSSSDEVAAMYAKLKREGADTQIVLIAELTQQELGKVLDLTEGAMGRRWDEYIRPIMEKNGKNWFVNENYYERTLLPFLDMLGAQVDDFDTIIGHEYIRGGKQYKFRRGTKVHDKVVMEAQESLLKDMP
ncbi:hypothetical protein [Mesorhizobium onobrychidis]|uniref:Uncharacterized protein n=1 Tax=Mesorhizobium onobrychidis TaxID=2775404 RepID=A0ABY5R895_9HYPH|nr:hypothetical protein [Mesorhizobium onobrychidis]UVC19414.1 hypothetical protein IHQ72_35785 [Mesorhizobium onobrychidis]